MGSMGQMGAAGALKGGTVKAPKQMKQMMRKAGKPGAGLGGNAPGAGLGGNAPGRAGLNYQSFVQARGNPGSSPGGGLPVGGDPMAGLDSLRAMIDAGAGGARGPRPENNFASLLEAVTNKPEPEEEDDNSAMWAKLRGSSSPISRFMGAFGQMASKGAFPTQKSTSGSSIRQLLDRR